MPFTLKQVFFARSSCISIFLFFGCAVSGQDVAGRDDVDSIPSNLIAAIIKNALSKESEISRQAEHYLVRSGKAEAKLKSALAKKDPGLCRFIFSSIGEDLSKIKKAAEVSPAKTTYICHLDSLCTAINFIKTSGKGKENMPEVDKALAGIQKLQDRLNYAGDLQKLIGDREDFIKQQLASIGRFNAFNKYERQVYYYKAQLAGYKQELTDPGKAEEKLIKIASRNPDFAAFFSQNSQLSTLFANPYNSTAGISLQGLQTKETINQVIRDRFGTESNVKQVLQENVQKAQSQLNEIKSKVSGYSAGSLGSPGDAQSLPLSRFNDEKGKPFLKRLQVGFNIQSQRAAYYFPVTTDLGISVGYRLNEKFIIGIGSSYKLGLGKAWNKLSLSHEGIGFRAFSDWQLKGGFLATGGYELNYRAAFNSIEVLKNYSAWQPAGLVGVGRQINLKKKMKCTTKLLWDFLSYRQYPKTPAFTWRIEYTLK